VNDGATGSLVGILRDLWHARDLVHQLVLRDIRIKYTQAVMGFAWAVFTPLIVVAAGVMVRLIVSAGGSEPLDRHAVAATVVKAVPWSFVVGAIGFAVNSLLSNSNLVTKVFFARESLPLASVLAQSVDAAVGAMAVLVLLPFLGVMPSWSWLWGPLLASLLLALVLAASLLLSAANLFFRDVKYIVQVVLTFGIFATPVFFEPAALPETIRTIVMLNPIAAPIEGLRLALVEHHSLLEPVRVTLGGTVRVGWEPWWLLYSAALAALGLPGALLVFRRLQHEFAERI
jgi:lipopolysaccharide transport system permease protein